MSYWICEKAEIVLEGQAVEMSFRDKHSLETMTIRLPAENWKDIFHYRAEYERPQREMWEAHKNIARALWNEIELKKEKLNKPNPAGAA